MAQGVTTLMRLKGRVAIVTGAARGIGFGTVKKFLQEGARVAFCDIHEADVRRAETELSVFGEVRGYVVDITDAERDKAFAAEVVRDFGTIDILINNAGINADRQFYKMTLDEFDRVIDVNVKGTFRMSQAVLPTMMEKRYGKIIHASSISPIAGNFGQSNYGASKMAIIGMTRSMGRELGKYNINVNALAPGFTRTEMTNAIPPDVMKAKLERIPLKRAAEPEDIANIYAFLASDEASFINGTCIIADGGMHGC